jgi:hypothetical protein
MISHRFSNLTRNFNSSPYPRNVSSPFLGSNPPDSTPKPTATEVVNLSVPGVLTANGVFTAKQNIIAEKDLTVQGNINGDVLTDLLKVGSGGLTINKISTISAYGNKYLKIETNEGNYFFQVSDQPQPNPTPIATFPPIPPTPSPAATFIPAATPIATPRPTSTPAATPTRTPTATPPSTAPTSTPIPPTASSTPTRTPPATPTSTAPRPTPSMTPRPTERPTSTPTPTNTPSPTPFVIPFVDVSTKPLTQQLPDNYFSNPNSTIGCATPLYANPLSVRVKGINYRTEYASLYGGQNNIYSFDSDMGLAAYHANLVDDGEVATIQITVVGWVQTLESVSRRGVVSSPWPRGTCCVRLSR